MGLKTLKCNHFTLLGLKGLIAFLQSVTYDSL